MKIMGKITCAMWLSLMLLCSGASLTMAAEPDPEADARLVIAAGEGRVDEVKQLIADGANVNAANAQGRTALMTASYFGNARIVELLLAAGVDVNAKDKDGMTALISAAQAGSEQVVRSLIANGADVKAATQAGMTARSSAEIRGYASIVTLLDEASGEGGKKKSKKK